MAEVLFNKIFLLAFLLLIQVESFFFLCYSPVIFLTKVLKIKKTNQSQLLLSAQNTNAIYFFIYFISIFFIKFDVTTTISLITLSIFFLYKISKSLDSFSNTVVSNNIIYLILPSFGLFLFLLFFVNSFLVLFFFIELYGVLYYFCFLTSYSFTSQTILKYKNGLLLLLWNNFLTTFFLGLGCFFLAKVSGSTNFAELSLLTVDIAGVYFFLLGLSWKLGLPLFHFFKLEVYKYLLKENVFLFSILTTLINLILFYVCFTQPVVFNTVYMVNFLLLIFIFAILLVIINLKLTNFLQFFALSGVFTLTTVMSVFLI